MGRAESEDAAEEIGRVRAEWLKALARGDVERLVSMVTDDVVFLPPNSPPVQGKGELRALYVSLLKRFRIEQEVSVRETRVEGRFACEWGGQTFVMHPRRGGPPVSITGYGVAVYRREDDGAWRYAKAISNLGDPAESGAAF